MGTSQLDLPERVHVPRARGLVEEVGQIEEVEQPAEGALGSGRALCHQGDPPHLWTESTDDQAGVAKGQARDDEAPRGERVGHPISIAEKGEAG